MLPALLKRQPEGAIWRLLFKTGGETMNKTPTKEIMTDDIVYKNRSEQPPDSGV